MICIPLPFRVLLIWLFLKLKSWNRIICYFLEMMSRLEGPLKQGKKKTTLISTTASRGQT